MKRVLVMAVLLGSGAAFADDQDDVPIRNVRIAERSPNLIISASFADVFDPEMLDQLSSGFATTVVLRAYVYKRGSDIPAWASGATWRVVYDLWKEVFLIQIVDAQGERLYTEKSKAEALRLVTTVVDFPVAPLAQVVPQVEYFVGVEVEVNPVSPELLAEVRRWLLRPSLGGASFFGGFVSIFLNPKVAEADRTLRFRSRAFYRNRK